MRRAGRVLVLVRLVRCRLALHETHTEVCVCVCMCAWMRTYMQSRVFRQTAT